MSSLLRYKKSGGFVQLLSLIETFGPQKREKFLEMIEAENAVWAKALRQKMLTLERILSWPDQVVIEVFKNLPVKNLTLALEAIKEEQKARLLVFFSGAEKRRMADILAEAPPKPEELSSNMVKVVELTRKMLNNGDLRAEKFDEGLMIPEEFESKLEGQATQAIVTKAVDDHTILHSTASQASGPATNTLEVAALQRTLAMVAKENKILKEELIQLRGKLEQIKRIA